MKVRIKEKIKFILFLLKINWIKTLRVNFKTLKFNDAVKLPIIIFGKCKIFNLKGKITFNCKVKFGTVLIGRDCDHHPLSTTATKIQIKKNIIFNGPIIFSGGCNLTNWDGVIEFGKYVVIGSGTVIKSSSGISIGNYTRITTGCTVMDTNVHFLIDYNKNIVSNVTSKIKIGNFCWINSGCVVTKGADIPNYSIAAQNSYINKAFVNISQRGGVFLAGAPASIKNANLQRIFSYKKEVFLKEVFNKSNCETIPLDSFISHDNYIEKDCDFVEFFKLY